LKLNLPEYGDPWVKPEDDKVIEYDFPEVSIYIYGFSSILVCIKMSIYHFKIYKNMLE